MFILLDHWNISSISCSRMSVLVKVIFPSCWISVNSSNSHLNSYVSDFILPSTPSHYQQHRKNLNNFKVLGISKCIALPQQQTTSQLSLQVLVSLSLRLYILFLKQSKVQWWKLFDAYGKSSLQFPFPDMLIENFITKQK